MSAKLPFDPDWFEADPNFPPEGTTSIQTIGLSVATLPNGSVAVAMVAQKNSELAFTTLMCACEYLMFITAQNSGAGFEKALESLCKGAMTYRHTHVPKDPPRQKP